MKHRTEIRPVPVPEWTLHWPQCSCGWRGDIVRTRALAQGQEAEHLAETRPTTEQPALFDDLEV